MSINIVKHGGEPVSRFHSVSFDWIAVAAECDAISIADFGTSTRKIGHCSAGEKKNQILQFFLIFFGLPLLVLFVNAMCTCSVRPLVQGDPKVLQQ